MIFTRITTKPGQIHEETKGVSPRSSKAARGSRPWTVGMVMTGLALNTLVAACDPDTRGIRHSTKDSLGVRVVTTYLDGPLPAAFELVDTIPIVDIGAIDGPPGTVLGSISGVHPWPEVGIAALDGQQNQLRIYTPLGDHLFDVGRVGDGPGEFGVLSNVAGISADTIWVWDEDKQRLTSFDSNGQLQQTINIRGDAFGRAREVFLFPNRVLFAVSRWRPRESRSSIGEGLVVVRDTAVFRVLGPRGGGEDTIAVLPNQETVQSVSASGGILRSLSAPRPFGRSLSYAVGTDRIRGGVNDRFEIRTWSVSGGLREVWRVEGIIEPPRDLEIARLKASLVASGPNSASHRRLVDQIFSEVKIPETRPAFGRMLPGPDGTFWVSRWESDPSGPSFWWVFAPNGVIEGTFVAPAGVEIHEIGDGIIFGSGLDEFGVPHVFLYQIKAVVD